MAGNDVKRLGQPGKASTARQRVLARMCRFLRATGGGATSIVATAAVVMTLGASAVIVDHNWLVDQRDVLKNMSDAAAIATSIEMERQRGSLSQDDMEDLLRDVARTYAVLNMDYLSGDRLTRARDSLAIETVAHLQSNRVDVSLTADLGGTLLAQHLGLTGYYTGPATITTGAAVEIELNPVEVVLAIDVSNSMGFSLEGRLVSDPADSRIEIVKQAARDLVDALDPNPSDRIAVGLVPWQGAVRLRIPDMRRWWNRGWVTYPSSRHFPATYVCNPRDTCNHVSEDQDLLPVPPQGWSGCMDEHRVDNRNHAWRTDAADYFETPHMQPFAQAIFPAFYGASYDCVSNPPPSDFVSQYCFSSTGWYRDPQTTCLRNPPRMRPLSSDRHVIDQGINTLRDMGSSTYSALGLLWGQRMLEPDWRPVWNDPVHPVDPNIDANAGVRKAIVLLTDGEDTRCGTHDPNCETNGAGLRRIEACNAVKARGTEIYVVAAMADVGSDLADALRACSSEADDPGSDYVFLNHQTADSLRAAFEQIADQLRIVRRIY